MEKWEYLTKFIYANTSKPSLSKYAPEAMVSELNHLGALGWEVVHMEPVAKVGTNGDILFLGGVAEWSNAYFCVLKRRVLEQSEANS